MKGAGLVDTALEVTVVGSFSRVGYATRSRLGNWDHDFDLTGRRVLLTGGTSGVGLAAACAMARSGAHLAITGRNADRLAAAAAEVAQHGERPLTVQCDQADLPAVRDMFHAAVTGLGGLDVLVNNAGALSHTFTESPQGFESTYAVHVLAPFLLTRLALPVAHKIITVSSGGMYTQALRPDMQMSEPDYDGVVAYARAKRAQVVLNEAWARRHPDRPTFAAMHPGWADTPGVQDSLPGFRRLTRTILRTPAQGADTVVWLAATPIPSGRFWLDRTARSTVWVPGTGYSSADADRLFDVVSGQVAPALV